MDESVQKIKRMAAWTIAIFATILAVTFSTLWLVDFNTTGSGFEVIKKIISQAWIIVVADVVLCYGAFLGYRTFMVRRLHL